IGWSQDRAAAVFGCQRNQISDYERQIRRPNYGRVMAMARAYNLDIDYLTALWDGREELAAAKLEIRRLTIENQRLWKLLLREG
ncbi:helix-turn-helix domain-containing protein, partial [Mycobacterium tuberculosis]|nr:helix-turn-helix domain-containing protein [Mycobacterium tuberculosis]